MAVQMVLRRPMSPPATQLRIVWQGHREGDLAEARWSDVAGEQRWPGAGTLRWIQRDSLRQGEEWKVNLPGVPAGVDRIVLRMASAIPRTVGMAVLPLIGDANDAALHPGAELTARQPLELLELTRSGQDWLITATNTAVPEDLADTSGDSSTGRVGAGTAPTAPPAAVGPATGATAGADIPGWSGPVTDRPIRTGPPGAGATLPPPPHPRTATTSPGASPAAAPAPAPANTARWNAASEDQGPQVQIPARLESAVDAARSTGNTRRRTMVGAVVDLSASMRPWLVSGQLADVLTAVQAVAGVSNRPTVATRFLPGGAELELELGTEPADLLGSQVAAAGLQTGDRTAMLSAVDRATRRGGLHILITDDASASAATGAAAVVLLGSDSGAVFGSPGREKLSTVVTVPAGPVDIRRLARQLANATAG